MEIENKLYKFAIKDLDEEGKFRGYLSVFNVIDHGGDLVEKGAFRKTLRQTRAFPLLWAHSAAEPSHVIGTFHGQEDEHGLLIMGEFFMDQAGGHEAYGVVKKLMAKKVKVGLSIGYKAEKFKTEETEDGKIIRRLKEIQLFEGSMTLFPMNQEAVVQAVKDAMEGAIEQKPYPNNHACRLNDPGKYERFVTMKRKHDGKEYSAIIGFKKGGGSEDQAYRYPKDTWSADEARAHCKDHGGTFEAAAGKDIEFRCANCGETVMVIADHEFENMGAEDQDEKAFVNQEPDEESIPGDEPPDGGEDEISKAQIDLLKTLVEVSKS